ncbi:hypothetical protein ACFTQ7_04135, partial [Lysinibacillus sp. NPDC056959]|uniref:hypothetical protein n=1 Tax=Lysinibacillus sp. NPDC056959 TaxID=3345981 RepID=UPI003636DBE2
MGSINDIEKMNRQIRKLSRIYDTTALSQSVQRMSGVASRLDTTALSQSVQRMGGVASRLDTT